MGNRRSTEPRGVHSSVVAAAERVLDGNWTGRYTRPAPGIYPHQWSWDSGFVAIGNAHRRPDRARRELRSLFEAQWSNGLVPHIVFAEVPGYFPGPEVWQVERSPHAPPSRATSGLVQPPIHATAARHIWTLNPDDETGRWLEWLYPRLEAWHDFLYRDRDPEGEYLVAIRHPWESGEDNSPIWDHALERVRPAAFDLPREDLRWVDPDDRPRDITYRRYLGLLVEARDAAYDERRLARTASFYVQDVLFNTLLVEAERDLAALARVLGVDGHRHAERAERTATAMEAKLWADPHGLYFDFDLRAGAPIHAHVAAGFSPLFAGVPSPERAEKMVAAMSTCGFCALDDDCWAVPSYDRTQPGYEPRRYWRGPIWININWLLHQGLHRYGYTALADNLRRTIIELPRRSGFYEYFDPDTGEGHGARDFSWTAALLIDLLADEPEGGSVDLT